jgi:hypothetical protein
MSPAQQAGPRPWLGDPVLTMPWLSFIKNRAKADAGALGDAWPVEKSGFARFESAGPVQGFNSCADRGNGCLFLRQLLPKN